ncbi:MAG: ComF family protein [Actinomycetota bacterium]|nr:ComF family protein [Actinomycetota bacterium]
MLLTVTCPVCGAAGRAPCASCAALLHPAPALPPPPGVDACLALLAYEGAGRELVARLKYRNHRAVLPGLAAAMASLVVEPGTPMAIDVVTWAPTTASRRRQRGFDHAELLARAVAGHLRRPCARLLSRRPGPPQTGRPLAERGQGPRLVARRWLAGAAVLLVDDVVTSGSTVRASAVALRSAGASSVVVLAAARTPQPGAGVE